ncbi:hypothetical protein BJY00DRAFT_322026 [Aspergillus carlsbadensis]|nr:hypothetical protein BJY00DRAFT_322026 [Aspergillus carlsbadensis]
MAFDCYCAICGVGFSGMRIRDPPDRQEHAEDSTQRPSLPREENSYDPRLVDQESLAWTKQVHCLKKHDLDGKPRALVSGLGYYADAGELVVKMGERAKRTYFNCYGFGTDKAPGPVVPFHYCCFEVLLQALTGSTDVQNVDLDVLYDVMMGLCNGPGSALCLEYGDDVINAQGQYWQCLPGAESLTQASMFIHLLTRDDHFWRRFIEADLPWLWEAKVLRDDQGELNHQEVHAWLDAATKPRHGLNDPVLMGVANRRRIWRACEGVVRGYRALFVELRPGHNEQ